VGNPKGALPELRNAMDVNPRNPETRMLLGRADMALFLGVQAEKEF